MSIIDPANKNEWTRGVNPRHPVTLNIDGSPLKRDAGNSALQVRVIKKNRWAFPIGSLVWLHGLAPHCMGKTISDVNGSIAYPVFESDADTFEVIS